jgi:hypothetical protein
MVGAPHIDSIHRKGKTKTKLIRLMIKMMTWKTAGMMKQKAQRNRLKQHSS